MKIQETFMILILGIILIFGLFVGCNDKENPYSPPEESIVKEKQPIEKHQLDISQKAVEKSENRQQTLDVK